jgi:hypothetical protein
MLTTRRNARSAELRTVPSRTASAKASMRSRSASTCRSISAPPISAPRGWRSATCSAGRPSVPLMTSPLNIASIAGRSATASARAASPTSAAASTRWRE